MTQRGSRLVIVWLAVVAPTAPARANDGPSNSKAGERADLAIRMRAVLEKHCATCHTGRAEPGHSLLPLLSHKAVIEKTTPIAAVTPGAPSASLILQLIQDGSMPPGGRPRLSPGDIDIATRWLRDGAPGYPRAFDDAGTLEALLDDWDAQPKDARPFVQYVSFAHRVQDARPTTLDESIASLRRAISDRSGVAVNLEPIDGSATLFRLDLRTSGWHAANLFERVGAEGKDEPSPITPFDLILLEYPFAAVEANALADRVRAFQTVTKQARPIAFLRGDWLDAAISRNTPLAADLDSLRELKAALDAGMRAPRGPKVQLFPPAGKSAVTGPIVPPGSWYASGDGKIPGPGSLEIALTKRGGGVPTSTKDLFNLFARSKAELYLDLLLVAESDVKRLTITDGKDRPLGRLAASSELRMLRPEDNFHYCIEDLFPDTHAKSFHLVLFASELPFPAPAVICSKHQASQIWRIVPAESNGFDPNRVVRKVLPIRVEQ